MTTAAVFAVAAVAETAASQRALADHAMAATAAAVAVVQWVGTAATTPAVAGCKVVTGSLWYQTYAAAAVLAAFAAAH